MSDGNRNVVRQWLHAGDVMLGLQDHKVDLIFHLYAEPSFDPPVGWTVYYPHYPIPDEPLPAGMVIRVHRVTLKKDYQWPGEETDLIFHEAILNRVRFEELMTAGNQIAIPLIGVNPYHGLDGTTYVLRRSDCDCGFSLNWWSNGPEQWRPLTAWVQKMQLFLEYEISKANQPHHRKP